jgi:hypothetical protein
VADRLFARAGLADFLAARGVAFETFDDFYDIDAALGGAAHPPTGPLELRGRGDLAGDVDHRQAMIATGPRAGAGRMGENARE